MDQLPTRPPSICSPSAQDVSFETVDIGKIFIPANALIITEDEHVFLAMTSVLNELKRVLLSRKVGYVFFGKIGARIVFVLNAALRTSAASHSIRLLKPRATIFLGFCKSTTKSIRVGDVVLAESLLRKDPRNGKLGSHPCSEYLFNVFYDGRFGWISPKYRKQVVHNGKVLQGPRRDKISALAVKISDLDIPECCSNLTQEWISIFGVIGPRCFHSNMQWEPYVAAVVVSYVNRVLLDDQVFSVLAGEERSLGQNTVECAPLQESDSPTNTRDSTHFSPDFSQLKAEYDYSSEFSQENVKRQAEYNWQLLKEAIAMGYFDFSHEKSCRSVISLKGDPEGKQGFAKTPVENYEHSAKSITPALRAPNHCDTSLVSLNGIKSTSGRVALPPIASSNTDHSNLGVGRDTSLAIPKKMQSTPLSALNSGIAVAMQTLLPPLGASLVTRGSCFEVIRVKTEERSTVRHEGALPPIGQPRNSLSSTAI